jgi:hypothetical protein
VVEEKAVPRTIKVVDRRRFTTEGDPRSDVPRETGPAAGVEPSPSPDVVPPSPAPQDERPSAQSEPAKDPPEAPTSQARPAPSTSRDFVELVASLAQQAEILLVGAQDLPAEPEQARRIIDYLAALESKTAGNVSPEEQQILSNVLFQLRALFVQGRG